MNPSFSIFSICGIMARRGFIRGKYLSLSVALFFFPFFSKCDSLETDLNFDGYKDIRLFDTSNGNYRLEWIYFVWDPIKSIFANDIRLNEISLANFDQDKQLIYGMERGSATDHYFSTYKYINEVPTLIRHYSQEYLHRSNEEIRKYLEKASVKTEIIDIIGFHETVLDRNEETGEMETISDEYVFYPNSDVLNENEIIVRFDISSDIGRVIEIGN